MEDPIARLLELIKAALGIVGRLKELQTRFLEQVDQAKRLEELRKLVRAFLEEQARLIEVQREHLEQARQIAEELSQEPPPPPPGAVRPDAIAKQFSTLIETIQRQAGAPHEGESAATIKNIDIELKGLIVIDKGEARIAPPSPDKSMDPGQLSTIRMSFGAIPAPRLSPEQSPEDPE